MTNDETTTSRALDPTLLSAPYSLGWSAEEIQRLGLQAIAFEDATRRFLSRIGLAPGMRVLDVGSGTGAVAFLAAEIVGESGAVVGTDIEQRMVALANSSAAEIEASNRRFDVRFIRADPTQMHFDQPFDAVVGRLVLMHYPDPSDAIARLVKHLRPGGIIAFQEIDYSGARSSPALPLFSQCVQWVQTTLSRLGADPEMGLKLRRVFLTAGLPDPDMCLEAVIGGGEGFIGYDLAKALLHTLLPHMERLGIATAENLSLGTLPSRLAEEVAAAAGVVVLPPLVGAGRGSPARSDREVTLVISVVVRR